MPAASQLARLARVTALLQYAAAAAWFGWWWPRSLAIALAGAAGAVLFGVLVLAVEFVLLAWVQRTDASVAAASAGQLARAWLAEACALYRVFYGRQPWRWRSPADHLPRAATGRCGVVFIHGFVCNRGFWAPWLQRLRADGHPFMAVNLEPVFTTIDAYTPIVEDAVQRLTALTGRPPVLVCHSMGGLVARAWLRDQRAAHRVQHVVTIGSPHRGTWLGRFSSMPNGRQMRLGSAWLRTLEADERALPRPPCTCWYSNCDNIVFPASTATLPGADNRFVTGAAHVQLAFHPAVIDGTLQLLGANPCSPSR